jgi:ASC-1-like (ASCH) protein
MKLNARIVSMKRKRRAPGGKRMTKNTTMDPTVVRKALRLAALEKRNYSNFLEVLVEREFDRVFPEEAAKLRLQLLKEMAA